MKFATQQKIDLLAWSRYNKHLLGPHELYATGTTGKILEKALAIPIHKLRSGPLGRDQQIGAMIAKGEVDVLIFFWDPLSLQPHEADVRALLRLAAVWNIPVACNRASADYIISSPLLSSTYQRFSPDYQAYNERMDQDKAEERMSSEEVIKL